MQQRSDDELMELVKSNNAQAFDQLYHRHKAAVYGFCMRLFTGNRAQVDETSQDVWLKVIRGAENYQARGTFKSWLMMITYNESISVLRRKTPDFSLSEEEAMEVPDDFDLEKEMLSGYGVEAIRAAVESLPDSQKAVLLLWVEEASYDEICRKLNLEWNSVRALLYRARQNLRAKLEGK